MQWTTYFSPLQVIKKRTKETCVYDNHVLPLSSWYVYFLLFIRLDLPSVPDTDPRKNMCTAVFFFLCCLFKILLPSLSSSSLQFWARYQRVLAVQPASHSLPTNLKRGSGKWKKSTWTNRPPPSTTQATDIAASFFILHPFIYTVFSDVIVNKSITFFIFLMQAIANVALHHNAFLSMRKLKLSPSST